jgi:hypothetical protein
MRLFVADMLRALEQRLGSSATTAGAAMKVIEIQGREKYAEWMQENDGRYKVVRVAATNLGSNSWPALSSAFIGERTFTIIYDELLPASP